ncbi:MAG: sugar phosphate isomerase/epimerase [Phycisphaeraceae bacterium]
MKLAFSAPTRDDKQTRELMTGFVDAGYAGLQLKTTQFRTHLDDPSPLFDAWPALRGRISGLIIGGRLDQAGCDVLRQVFRFAGEARAELVIFCHGEPRDGLTHADLAQFADVLDLLGREARDAGTKLSLHQHFNNPCMHRADLDVFFGRARSYGLTVDTAHLAKSGVADIPEVIRSFAGVIDNFHIKDLAGDAFTMLGTGDLHFEPIFEAIGAIEYDGWLAADEESGADVSLAMRHCHEFITAGLRDATPA